jgi:hypothetical protein
LRAARTAGGSWAKGRQAERGACLCLCGRERGMYGCVLDGQTTHWLRKVPLRTVGRRTVRGPGYLWRKGLGFHRHHGYD